MADTAPDQAGLVDPTLEMVSETGVPSESHGEKVNEDQLLPSDSGGKEEGSTNPEKEHADQSADDTETTLESLNSPEQKPLVPSQDKIETTLASSISPEKEPSDTSEDEVETILESSKNLDKKHADPSKDEIEKVLKYAALLSLYHDPQKDKFKYKIRRKLNPDRDFDTVQSLLSAPGLMKKDNSFAPRLDLFVINCSDATDYRDVGRDEAAADADGIASHWSAAGIVYDALEAYYRIQFNDWIRTYKAPGRVTDPTVEADNYLLYRITSAHINIVWSFYRHTGQTVGILTYRVFASGEKVSRNLIDTLISNRSLTACSMLPALAAQEALSEYLGGNLSYYYGEIQDIAMRTGYFLPLKPAAAQQDSEYDPAAETAKASGLADSVVIDESCWEGLRNLADLALRETKAMEKASEDADNKCQAELSSMKELILNSSQSFEARRGEAASLQQRASIQIQGLFNIIAQREQELSRQLARDSLRLTEASLQLGEATRQIAEDSKRDSTSMKAIAAVTMFFLPGTFAASLFAMPVFRWNAASGNDVISHRIWVYWAVTLPLTLITFSCYLLWDHLMNKPRYEHLKVNPQNLKPVQVTPAPRRSSINTTTSRDTSKSGSQRSGSASQASLDTNCLVQSRELSMTSLRSTTNRTQSKPNGTNANNTQTSPAQVPHPSVQHQQPTSLEINVLPNSISGGPVIPNTTPEQRILRTGTH